MEDQIWLHAKGLMNHSLIMNNTLSSSNTGCQLNHKDFERKKKRKKREKLKEIERER